MAPKSGREYPNLLTIGGPTNHTGSGNVTPNVQNAQLLNTVFKFKRGAPLKIYLSKITSTERTYYTLREILTIIKKVIGEEKMFDERNPSVILCSEELEQALDQKALHVTEVRDLVMNQIEKVLDAPLGMCGSINIGRPGRLVQQPKGPLQSETPRLQRTVCVTTNIQDAKFRLKPLFLIVVRSVEGTNPEQTIFTYQEVTLLLSKYILAKKDVLFDHRNIKLAIVKNDPLGAAFGVSAFHRCQANALLRSQLIPLHPDTDENGKLKITHCLR